MSGNSSRCAATFGTDPGKALVGVSDQPGSDSFASVAEVLS
jgi:hypothetical protein